IDGNEHQDRPRKNRHEEDTYGKLKFKMPTFTGSNDPKEYLSWALKVDKIYHVHNYTQEKMVAMASLEFDDYANL
ncbi:hypothetical protein JBE27_57365, partial [Streptomyces albiflaviniger]|nr:hypothetical protein [Streptomyces albiflaviniger]